jgi:hypothetical protein
MIHVVVMKCLTGLPLIIHMRFYEGVGVGVLKIEESESEVLCTDSTALPKVDYHDPPVVESHHIP